MIKNEMLRRLLDQSGYKLQYVAGILDMTPNTLRKKLYGETEFKVSEAMRLSALLRLTAAERDECFFGSDSPAILERRLAYDKRAAQSDKIRPVSPYKARRQGHDRP